MRLTLSEAEACRMVLEMLLGCGSDLFLHRHQTLAQMVAHSDGGDLQAFQLTPFASCAQLGPLSPRPALLRRLLEWFRALGGLLQACRLYAREEGGEGEEGASFSASNHASTSTPTSSTSTTSPAYTSASSSSGPSAV
eukprot:CAMPEP_0173207088 /NCGR_PEP_ID=MMETSP1141-20130122/21736_1 /TAXON_ID=483371 /ORGANISM="non described non described, Strain CCMP2298" /LENGTH=137 /DNA_ID=CAMNT_0014133329 /DNA_START=117 /DNA_END=526 /DNA_ORIENTATION=+